MGCGNSLPDPQSPFKLKGIQGKCRIIKIVDGDTFDVVYTFKADDLRSFISTKNLSKTKIIFRTRLYGIDVYEKNTDKGKEAIAYLKKN